MLASGGRRAAALASVIGSLALAPTASAVSLYATNQSGAGSVAQFTIGPTGALTSVPCSSDCSAAETPFGIAIAPSGDELFTSDQGASGALSSFAIGPLGGVTPISCSAACATGAGTSPFAIAVDPAGPYVYTADQSGSTVFGFEIGAGGMPTALPCSPVASCQTGAGPHAIAIDPSGRFLYTANETVNSISAFAIAAGGTLSPITCSACSAVAGGNTPLAIAIDPTGRFVYATNFTGGSATPPGVVEVFAIGATGALTPVPCGGCQTGSGSQPSDVVVDPTGRYVYTADAAGAQLDAFSIGAGGTLTRITCTSGCATQPGPKTLVVDPSGKFLYVGYQNSTISAFAITSDGSLNPISCAGCHTSGASYGLAVVPDPGPTATLLTGPAPAGTATTLSAAGSSSPSYPIATYTWNFGDGATTTTTSPAVAHVYASAGTYDASVTVTDQAGCSTAVIFTGQSPYCDGSTKATATSAVTIASPLIEPPPSILEITQARESNRVWREGRRFAQIARVLRPVPTGTTFSFDVNEKARVTLSFAVAKPGRTVGRRCVAEAPHNRRSRRCQRYVRQTIISLTAHPGRNTVVFQGRLRRKRWLPLGSYGLTIAASARGHQRAAPARLAFRIVR